MACLRFCRLPLESAACHGSRRTPAAEIARVLERLLAGEAFLARRRWREIWWGQMHLDLASGWQLQIAIDRDQLGALQSAQAPDGRDWVYGCQRDDWTLGPHSRIVEPVALLSPDQQQALELVLRQAICWPPPPGSCGWFVPMVDLEPSSQTQRGRRSPAHRAATRASRGALGRRSRSASPAPHFESETDMPVIQIHE